MRLSKALLLFFIFVLFSQYSNGQEVFEHTIKQTLSFSNSQKLLSVHNINGHVNIEGYAGSQAVIEAEQYIKTKRGGNLEDAKAEIDLKIVEDNGVVIVYVEEPHSTFNLRNRNYRFDNHNYGRRKYHYNFDITIKVPFDTDLEASTMNDGNLVVENIESSSIDVNNLNGKITLTNISGQINANALNKDIDIVYSKNPTQESWFNALNGDVNITVPEDLDADITFKSLNGAFYSNLEASSKKGSITKTVSNNRKRTKYKVSSKNNFIIGEGGPLLHFDLLNGDVNLLK